MVRWIVLFVLGILLLPTRVSADGLQSYLSSLGPATDISVVARTAAGPSEIAFQSQVWRSIPWKHRLLIKSPPVLSRSDYVVLNLTGGDGGADREAAAQRLADALGIRVAILTRVPNQPLFDGRSEDVLLSFPLDQYRRSGDPSWPLLFPMVSSVVKGIDVLGHTLDQRDLKVVLIGASKRGWTTYLTAAVDRRIAAMVPTVFEMVSMQKQIALARARYGRDSEKIRPYTALGLTDSLLEPRVAQMISWIDPVHYAQRFTMPKLVLLGANDPYWVVDSVREYWSQLPGPKLLRILPNVGHGVLSEPAAQDAIVSFVRAVIGGKKLPSASWRFSSVANGVAIVSGEGNETLTGCEIWRATSETRDFRSATFGSSACDVVDGGRGFRATIPVEYGVNTAVFAQLTTKEADGSSPISLSTESQVYLANSRGR